mmetsp:Transcript_27946/g.49550  ORF Transcript_27946/g.49550 Transcript_27946/m.49550 type:complete len:479 (-) Transcript_27946:194-1630(-)
MPCPIFEYDLRKLDWCPEQLDELAEQVNHVFRTHVVLSDLEVIGTNHLDRRRIWTDDDLETWLRSENPAYSREGLEEDKILRVTLPQRVLPLEFKQGEVPVIIRGNKTAEFEGDGRADARLVEFKLKFFDCGHFYMTQSRANASTPMYSSYSSQSSSSQSSRNSKNLTWTVFEGSWRRSARGYRLEFLFKYPRTNTRSFDFIMQALPERNECSLNFSGEEEVNLKGFLPTVASHESSCWASMRRKAELPVNRRSNKMFDDQEEKEKKEEEEEEEEAEEEEPEKEEAPPKVTLTPDEKAIWFYKSKQPDLSSYALSTNFTSFSLPEKEDGFAEIRCEWTKPSSKCATYVTDWILAKKQTTRVEDLKPSAWFMEKSRIWTAALQKWKDSANAYKNMLAKKAADKLAKERKKAAAKQAKERQAAAAKAKAAREEAAKALKKKQNEEKAAKGEKVEEEKEEEEEKKEEEPAMEVEEEEEEEE